MERVAQPLRRPPLRSVPLSSERSWSYRHPSLTSRTWTVRPRSMALPCTSRSIAAAPPRMNGVIVSVRPTWYIFSRHFCAEAALLVRDTIILVGRTPLSSARARCIGERPPGSPPEGGYRRARAVPTYGLIQVLVSWARVQRRSLRRDRTNGASADRNSRFVQRRPGRRLFDRCRREACPRDASNVHNKKSRRKQLARSVAEEEEHQQD